MRCITVLRWVSGSHVDYLISQPSHLTRYSNLPVISACLPFFLPSRLSRIVSTLYICSLSGMISNYCKSPYIFWQILNKSILFISILAYSIKSCLNIFTSMSAYSTQSYLNKKKISVFFFYCVGRSGPLGGSAGNRWLGCSPWLQRNSSWKEKDSFGNILAVVEVFREIGTCLYFSLPRKVDSTGAFFLKRYSRGFLKLGKVIWNIFLKSRSGGGSLTWTNFTYLFIPFLSSVISRIILSIFFWFWAKKGRWAEAEQEYLA